MGQLNNLRVRQGALLVHIDAEARVINYELCINVPMAFSGGVCKVITTSKGVTRKYVQSFHQKWEDAMAAKLDVQLDVQMYKRRIAWDRMNEITERKQQLLTDSEYI